MMQCRRWLIDDDLQELLGKSVVGRRTILRDVLLVFFSSVECSGPAQKLMREACFVGAVILYKANRT